MNLKLFKKQNGYTLVELIIYIGIFSIVVVGIVSYLASTINAKISIDTQNDFMKQARIAFDTVYKEVRESYDYEILDSGTRIRLDKNVAGTSVNEIFTQNGRVYISRNGATAVALTQSTSKVAELIFENYTSTRSDDLIHIKLHLTNLDTKQNAYSKNDFRLSTSINVRNVAE